MKQKTKFSMKSRLQSVVHIFRGLKSPVKEKDHAKIHMGIGIILYVFTAILKLKKLEIVAILFSIAFVMAAELFNTAIENLCDYVHPHNHQQIKKIKDVSAAAVLIAAITAFIVGLIIYLPKLFY